MHAISHMWREPGKYDDWQYQLTVTDEPVDIWLALHIEVETEVVILNVTKLPDDFPHPEYGQ